MGFRIRMPARVQLLAALHKVLRLSWARRNEYCTDDDLKQYAWSKKYRFRLHGMNIRIWYGDNLVNPWISILLLILLEFLRWGVACEVDVILWCRILMQDSYRWQTLKRLIRRAILINIYCPFRRVWRIQTGQCDKTHVESCHRGGPRTLYLILDTSICHLNSKIWT